MEGCVFDIQRFSVHDGPAIRTTVFLKGCPLRCRWCCNPESMHPQPELLYNRALCIGCRACLEACPNGATLETLEIDRSRCVGCGNCAAVCFAEAKTVKGRNMTPEQVLEEVMRDRDFYQRTGGGATFSGGEPLAQIDFLERCLQLCRAHEIGTAIETCGFVPWEHFERIADLVDHFLFDIKNTNSQQHAAYTGVPCEQILENCRRLAAIAHVVVRVPVIPQFNFDRQTLEQTVRFAEEIGVEEIHFLPYHRLAANKYRFLDRDYWNPGVERLEPAAVEACVREIPTHLHWRIGG